MILKSLSLSNRNNNRKEFKYKKPKFNLLNNNSQKKITKWK